MGKRVEQFAECRRDRLLVRQTIERRALTGSGVGTTSRHVGRLIPSQDITAAVKSLISRKRRLSSSSICSA